MLAHSGIKRDGCQETAGTDRRVSPVSPANRSRGRALPKRAADRKLPGFESRFRIQIRNGENVRLRYPPFNGQRGKRDDRPAFPFRPVWNVAQQVGTLRQSPVASPCPAFPAPPSPRRRILSGPSTGPRQHLVLCCRKGVDTGPAASYSYAARRTRRRGRRRGRQEAQH